MGVGNEYCHAIISEFIYEILSEKELKSGAAVEFLVTAQKAAKTPEEIRLVHDIFK